MGYVGAVVGVRPRTKGEGRVRKSFQGKSKRLVYQSSCRTCRRIVAGAGVQQVRRMN
jgi:hypothetical protein